MEIIKPGINIDFIGKRKIAYVVSLSLIIASVFSLIVKGGPRYGIDFAGGTLIQIKFSQPTSAQQIKAVLKSDILDITSIQGFGEEEENEFLIRATTSTSAMESLATRISDTLNQANPENTAEVRRVEMVGPKVGKDLREKALLAMFSAILLIVVYISGRFEMKWMLSIVVASSLLVVLFVLKGFGVGIPFLILAAVVITLALGYYLKLRFAMGAIVALIHDVLITVGVFSLANKEFTLPIIAALLTIIGYSLNDTIIVFDRIRENTRKYQRDPYEKVINGSINETLSRTVLTSGTTLIVVLALFILGGGVIHDFTFALLVGIAVGTYSSIYVASPILLLWEEGGRSPKSRNKGKR
jgi:preprotein translocase subunit SecF